MMWEHTAGARGGKNGVGPTINERGHTHANFRILVVKMQTHNQLPRELCAAREEGMLTRIVDEIVAPDKLNPLGGQTVEPQRIEGLLNDRHPGWPTGCFANACRTEQNIHQCVDSSFHTNLALKNKKSTADARSLHTSSYTSTVRPGPSFWKAPISLRV
jgi:hypothetical protein